MDNNRLKLGILLNFSPKWMGGIIYIMNIVKTLNYLDDEDKPEIFIFYNPELNKFLEEFEKKLNPRQEFRWQCYGTSLQCRRCCIPG